jgi:hypothetical protein
MCQLILFFFSPLVLAEPSSLNVVRDLRVPSLDSGQALRAFVVK